MRPVPWTVVCLLSVSLAGCADDGPNAEAVQEQEQEAAAGIPKPEWHVGMWWTWTYSRDDLGWDPVVDLIVSEEQGGGFLVETTSERWAFEEALFDHAILGLHRRADLAMNAGGSTAKIFDWPLTDGKTWTFDWYGLQVQAAGAAEADGRYRVDGTFPEGNTWRYWYDPAVAWLDEFVILNADGTEEFAVDVVRHPGNFTGQIVRADPTALVDTAGVGPHHETGTFDFTGAGDADVYGSVFLQCTQGIATVGTGPVENIPGDPVAVSDDGAGSSGPCPIDYSYFGLIGTQPETGTWGYDIEIASQDAEWALQVWLVEFERVSV